MNNGFEFDVKLFDDEITLALLNNTCLFKPGAYDAVKAWVAHEAVPKNPFDAVTDDKTASLPDIMTFFQLGIYIF